MKTLLIALLLTTLSRAQRPTYAGTSNKGYPELANRFKDTEDNTQNGTIENRFGEGDNQTDKNGQKIPTDARGDADLVNRLNTWPQENRPFWLINAEHIEKHRHPEQNTQVNGVPTVQNRFGEPSSETKPVKPQDQKPFFAGTASRRH